MSGLREIVLAELAKGTHTEAFADGARWAIQEAGKLALVASRERVAEILRAHQEDSVIDCMCGWRDRDSDIDLASHQRDALLAAGVFRDEATVKAELAEQIAAVAEEYADDLEPPTTSEWLELRDWFKGQLHEVAAKAYEIGGRS